MDNGPKNHSMTRPEYTRVVGEIMAMIVRDEIIDELNRLNDPRDWDETVLFGAVRQRMARWVAASLPWGPAPIWEDLVGSPDRWKGFRMPQFGEKK